MAVGILKDPVSSATHLGGFLAAVVGVVLIVVLSANDGPKVTGMAIYGGTLCAVFLSSAVYHFFDLGARGNRWLQRLDHAAIFLLIAGSYVPPLIHLLDGGWRISMLSVVGGLALAGVLFKIAWIGCPTWLGTAVYLALGWVVVIPAYRILPGLDVVQIALLATGGLAYSCGAIIYALERPDPWPDRFGHHEIWHLFVLAGAAAHFLFTWTLLGQPYPPF